MFQLKKIVWLFKVTLYQILHVFYDIVFYLSAYQLFCLAASLPASLPCAVLPTWWYGHTVKGNFISGFSHYENIFHLPLVDISRLLVWF